MLTNMNNLFSNKPLSEMSLTELKAQEQSFKTASRIMAGIMLLMVAATLIRIYLKAHFPGNTFLLLVCVFISFLTASRSKKINEEINSRG
jgi:hypothetical protein